MHIDITTLYKEYYPKLLYYAWKFLPYDKQRAEEIVDDVFLKIKLEKFKHANLLNEWLFKCVKHSCLNEIEYRKAKTIIYDDLQEFTNEPGIDSFKIMAEVVNKIWQYIDNFPPQCKKIFILHYINGIQYAEIARRMRLSENTIRNHVSRGLKILRMDIGLIEDNRRIFLVDKIQELRSKGFTTDKIANAIGMKKSDVQCRLSQLARK